MTRTPHLRTVLPIVLLAAAAAAPHAHAQPTAFTYVAAAGAGYTDLVDRVRVLKDLHPLGHFSFRSPGRSFTLTVDDHGTLTGRTIPVLVLVAGEATRACVPARTPTRLAGGSRGARVSVWIDTAWESELRCTGSGTTGTAYVSP